MEFVNIIINGKPVKAKPNEYITEVAKREGIYIPTLCNDDRLEPYTSCYVCVVEIEGVKKPQPACSTRVTEGMVITTDNERIFKARQTALNLLLSNHYADCVAPCKETCPAGVDVQGYITLIEKGLYKEAVELIKEVNPLPAICGRVCVRPCEAACRRNLLDEGAGVGIDYMKRFVSDYEMNSADQFMPELAPSTGKKVAIIGAGPGGLTAAYYLQIKGHQCDIFEAQSHPGGWLRYGIPEYRLPNDVIDAEVKRITDLGVNIFYNKKLGDNLKFADIQNNYDAVILTIGSQRGTLLGCEGEDADGVFSGIDFLRNMEVTVQRYDFTGKKIIVVGGGNTAMDCCRSSIRCGSRDVTVVYRRSEAEMPANPIEIHESKLEGVKYLFLHNPIRVNKDENGKVKSVTLIKMILGEPDASGRRRPIPLEGSEFDIEADYILAAIGQKTDINFLDDVNSVVKEGKLKANKWGDIDANPETLQTGVPFIFAAGDGVTGPATVIEAIAQANKAVNSCHQYLMGQKIQPLKKTFVSRKDNFRKQEKEFYIGRYKLQFRQEMPVLPAEKRYNYNEVELGYTEEMALTEAERCLECGCSEFFDCQLQQLADKYNVTQDYYAGEFKSYEVDFSHPLIEIDNNKCILCAKCIRTCNEIVGAKALGLVQRGFETFVAPSLNKTLLETDCESCGMCISVCPTGAIVENVPFKIMPVKPEKIKTIDCFTSEGASEELIHKSGFIFRAEGIPGLVNKNSNIGKHAKFGYRIFNDTERITKPMLKNNGVWKEISFDEALKIIKSKISGNENQTLVSASGRMTNEDLFLIQKFVRDALKTNNITSFNYFDRGNHYVYNSNKNIKISELSNARKIYILGSNINYDNPLINHEIFNAAYKYNTELVLITDKESANMAYKCHRLIKVNSYYALFKALNHIVIENKWYNKFFLDSHISNYEQFLNSVLNENYVNYFSSSGLTKDELISLANEINIENNAVIVFQEKEITSSTAREIMNFVVLTGKIAKTGSGILCVKEKNNSQGLIDMGISHDLLPGAIYVQNESFVSKVKNAEFENFLIFGEDPLGQAKNKSEINSWFRNKKFMVVQDFFMTETAKEADLILPSSYHFETGGSFTNTQKEIQFFEKALNPKTKFTSTEQLSEILKAFDINQSSELTDIFDEIINIIEKVPQHNLDLVFTDSDRSESYFSNTCDIVIEKVNKIFDF